MYRILVVLFCIGYLHAYNIQETYDPNELPNGESPDGGAYLASFNFTCDPWKNFTFINDAFYNTYPDFNGNYCPKELRSPSGCGDFKLDTRSVNCTSTWNLKLCSHKIILPSPQPVWKQVHLCVSDQMPEYQSLRPTLAPFGDLTFPPFGINRHRDYWAKRGEFEYLPSERWLHNTEHGFIVFLYRPCIEPEALCRIKQFILERPYDYTNSTIDPSNEGPFRWILTPYKDLVTKFALVTFPQTLFTDCFHEKDWNEFIDRNYRQGFEDLSLPGRYDYLWKGDSACPGYEPKTDVCQDDDGSNYGNRGCRCARNKRSSKKSRY
eukprot:TRINITY_DN1528_c0_g1_i1.p1 TRINITY_DN1528_c0_g1~~TRINITY_DN1528_c0_g1_i1.p1  ORF type:complete len:322 (+),score=38.73 TRINITY_DN1528_c0_g1_i1:92-1057(+)